MDKTNQDYANAILNALRDGLMDAVLSKYTDKYGGSYWEKVEELTKKRFEQKKLEHVKNELDPLELLELIKLNSRLFQHQKEKEPNLIEYTMQLTKLRNGNSHFSTGNEERLTDEVLIERAFLATRLLEAFDTKESRKEADVTRSIRETFLGRIEGETEVEVAMPDEQKVANASATAEFEGEHRPGASEVPHSESHVVQELLRQNDNLMQQMQRMQRQQASQLKTATSANAETMQQLIRSNQELMKQIQNSQLDRRPNHDDNLIQSLIEQNQAMMRLVQFPPPQASHPVINVNPTISPNISNRVVSPPETVDGQVERNDAAMVAGVLLGFVTIMGVAHLYNRKWGRGLFFLIIGTVLYWLLLIFLAALLNTFNLPLLILLVVHILVVWQQAKHGSRRRPSVPKAKRATP